MVSIDLHPSHWIPGENMAFLWLNGITKNLHSSVQCRTSPTMCTWKLHLPQCAPFVRSKSCNLEDSEEMPVQLESWRLPLRYIYVCKCEHQNQKQQNSSRNIIISATINKTSLRQMFYLYLTRQVTFLFTMLADAGLILRVPYGTPNHCWLWYWDTVP